MYVVCFKNEMRILMRQKKYILKQIAIICTAAFLFTGCGKADKSYDKGMEYIESED